MLKNSSSVKNAFINKVIKVLNLENFDIEVIQEEVIEVDGFENGACAGYNQINSNSYKCIVVIGGFLSQEEKEITLIHELCHLVNRDFRDMALEFTNEKIAEFMISFDERAIETFAQAIYKLIRGETK